MLSTRVKEGILEIDDEKIVVRHTRDAGLLENVFLRLVNIIKGKEDRIMVRDISMVVAEPGIEEGICPHILVYYGKKSRLIEFCIEPKGNSKPKIQKVLECLEARGIRIGFGIQI